LKTKAGANLLYFAAVFGSRCQENYQNHTYFHTKQNGAWNEPNFPHSLKHGPDPAKDTHSPAQHAKQKGFSRCILGEISGLPENTCNDHRPQIVFTELRQHAQEGTGMGRNISCPPKDSQSSQHTEMITLTCSSCAHRL
jgi:hypothetical protein